jgi:hypothetical protein
MKNNFKTILIILSIIIFFLIITLFFNKPVKKECDLNIDPPKIRPRTIYPGGPFSDNKEKNIFPKNPNLIIGQNAKLWGPPLAPPFPKPPWPPSL